MTEFYKLYTGDYEPKGGICSAPTIYCQCPFKHLSKHIQELLGQCTYGLDIYIVKPNKEVFAWHRDLVKYSKEDRKELLR